MEIVVALSIILGLLIILFPDIFFDYTLGAFFNFLEKMDDWSKKEKWNKKK